MTEHPLDHRAATQAFRASLSSGAVDATQSSDPAATQPLPPPAPVVHPVHRPPVMMIAFLASTALIAAGVLAVLLSRIEHTPSASAESAPKRFATPQALVDYLDRRGLTCAEYEAVTTPDSAVGRGRCRAAGDTVDVGVYSGPTQVEAEWTVLASATGPRFSALGDNWIIEGPADWTRHVADVLGAQFRSRQ